MTNEVIVGLLVLTVILAKIVIPALVCKVRGHKLKDAGAGILWKRCSCCNKTLVLHMASGQYVE